MTSSFIQSYQRTPFTSSVLRRRMKLPSMQILLREQRDYLIGIALLLSVVLLWTTSNFVTQNLFEGGFHKPFLVTYLNTSSFTLYLVPFCVKRWKSKHGTRGLGYQPLDTQHTLARSETPEMLLDVQSHLPPLTHRETIDLALMFCFLWFLANWSLNAALDYTSVASATILSSTSGLFTLVAGRLFVLEKLTVLKILAVLVSFGGVVLVSLSDSLMPNSVSEGPQPKLPLLGDLLALTSAIGYALYVTLLKVRIQVESRVNMQLFFGFVGLFNILLCWGIGVALHLLKIEPFGWPTSTAAIGAILVNMFITLSSDYLYLLAMLKTTPLVVTVGLSLTIPLAVIGDLLLGKVIKAPVIFGALMVIASFVTVGLDDARTRSLEPMVDSEIDGSLDHQD